jgi:hypothetical protein
VVNKPVKPDVARSADANKCVNHNQSQLLLNNQPKSLPLKPNPTDVVEVKPSAARSADAKR